MKLISIITPCYNEEENIEEIYKQVKELFFNSEYYNYEHIFIDNSSTDKTVDILKIIAAEDKNVKLIINTRNFGHIRSPVHAILQATGEAVVLIVADLQDPPKLITEFLKEWEEGWKIVVGVKSKTNESFIMKHVRRLYYRFISKISDIVLIKDFMGFGLYDRKVIEAIRIMDDPYPYFRGLVCETGFAVKQILYEQKSRRRGISKNNFNTLYDMAILGITNHSIIPLRIATVCGFMLSGLSLVVSIWFFILKLIFWNSFSLGTAPILIGMFFFSSVQLFFIGVLGEYIATIQSKVTKRPLVFEKERINF